MANRRGHGKRARHGTRKWIVKVMDSPEGIRGMLTSQIQSRVAKLSGSKIPPYSIYQALRTLVKRHRLQARRQGREYSYKFVTGGAATPAKPVSRAKRVVAALTPAPRPAAAVATPVSAPAVAPMPLTVPEAPAAVPGAPAAPSLHKLAPGEVALLHIGEAHVETATNVHGRIVLERHRRPK